MNLETYLLYSIQDLLLVLSELIYRKNMGIRMSRDEKIKCLQILLKKAYSIYVHCQIEYDSQSIDGLFLNDVKN
jgi:hypothetical protein